MGTILLLGGQGMLGTAFRRVVPEDRLRAPSHATCDLLDANTVARHLDGVDLVINCAAYTNVDAAEDNEAEAERLNGTAVGRLAALCAKHGAGLMHFSTDYVFTGEASAPYPVDAPIAPINAYGRSKALGERLVRESGCEHLIVRTSWLYAPWGKNFVRTIATLAESKDELRVVNDQRGRPTHVQHLAANALMLWQRGVRGTRHLTDGGEATWYDLAKAVVELSGADCTVLPCSTETFPRPARRPSYSVLDISTSEAELGYALRPWTQALAEALSTRDE